MDVLFVALPNNPVLPDVVVAVFLAPNRFSAPLDTGVADPNKFPVVVAFPLFCCPSVVL